MAAAPGDHQNPSSCSNHYYIGVDVGSGSARAGLFTSGGQLVMHCKEDIKLWKNDNHCEQSSEDIWRSVVAAIKVRTVQRMSHYRIAGYFRGNKFFILTDCSN